LLGFLNYFQVQTFQDYELIFIYDGSTDGSRKILKTFKKNKNIRVFLQTNKGQANARNSGLKKARAEYILFCDMDDVFYPKYLAKLFFTIKSNKEIDFVKCGVDIDLKDIHADWVGVIEGVLPSNTIFRKRIFSFIEGFPEDKIFREAGSGEDDCFFNVVRAFFNGGKIKDTLMKFVCKDSNTLFRFKEIYKKPYGAKITIKDKVQLELLQKRNQKIQEIAAYYKQKARKKLLKK
jgi:glycosyltransferase involved in cell wall biosynthesis